MLEGQQEVALGTVLCALGEGSTALGLMFRRAAFRGAVVIGLPSWTPVPLHHRLGGCLSSLLLSELGWQPVPRFTSQKGRPWTTARTVGL